MPQRKRTRGHRSKPRRFNVKAEAQAGPPAEVFLMSVSNTQNGIWTFGFSADLATWDLPGEFEIADIDGSFLGVAFEAIYGPNIEVSVDELHNATGTGELCLVNAGALLTFVGGGTLTLPAVILNP